MIGMVLLGLGGLFLLTQKRDSTPTIVLPEMSASPNTTANPMISKQDAWLAADQLAQYLRTTSAGRRNRNVVKAFQARMGGIADDGYYGPQTRARMEALIAERLAYAQREAQNV